MCLKYDGNPLNFIRFYVTARRAPMGSSLLQSTFLSLILAITFLHGDGHGKGAAKRQLYFGSSDVLLPESNSDIPSPIVLPSGMVPVAGAIPPAWAIAPSPLIGPAPAIRPANAIKEKNRATPMEGGKTKRFQLPFFSDPSPSSWNGELTQENTFSPNQFPAGENAVGFNPNQMTSLQSVPIVPNEIYEDESQQRDQLHPSSLAFQFLQGMYNSHNSKSFENKVDYFEPNDGEQDAQPYLDSTYADTGPSRDDMKKIQPLLDHENDIANAILMDSWKQDNALTSSRQALSEGLTTSHQLAKVSWNNRVPVMKKPIQQPTINDDMNDGEDDVPMGYETNHTLTHAQELPLLNNEPEKRPQEDETKNGELFLNQTSPMDQVKVPQQFPDKTNLTTNGKDNASSFVEVIKVLSPLNTSLHRVNPPEKQHQKLATLSSNEKIISLKNDWKNGNVSRNSSSKEWFTNAKLSTSNSSLEKTRLSKKPLTAAEYLQSLYPQLSVFKAPLAKFVRGNASLRSLLASALSNGNFNKTTHLAQKVDIKDALRNMRNIKLGSDVADRLLMTSLQRAHSMLSGRSAIKQYHNTPRYIKSSKMLVSRLKKARKEAPGYRYLTESGAKLLPGHIFSPLGSPFGDTSEPSSTPPAETSTSTAANNPTANQQTSFPLIVPTQAGQIQVQTQRQADKEPSTSGAIAPTQSGMIPTVANASEQSKGLSSSTISDKKPTISSEAFITPTRPTKLAFTKPSHVPTQSGFIPDLPLAKNTTFPTQAPLVPTQIGFIPSGKQKGKILTGIPENNSERKDFKPVTSRQELVSHGARRSSRGKQETRRTHLRKTPRRKGKKKDVFPHFLPKSLKALPPAHSRERRQMFLPVPLIQSNENLPQLGQSLLPVQQMGQQVLPDLSQMQQLQAMQQFLPTQQLQGLLPQLLQSPQTIGSMSLLGQQDLRSQLPLQPALNQPVPQTQLTPQQSPGQGLTFGNPTGDLNQLTNTLGLTPYQNVLSQQPTLNTNQAQFSPINVNVPMEAPKKIPSFVTASQVYRDFEDVNSRSDLANDLAGGPVSRADVPRNRDFTPYDQFPDEPKYDKFAYETDKKMWGMDNDNYEDEGEGILRSPPRKRKKYHFDADVDDYDSSPNDLDVDQSLTNLRYGTGGRRRHNRPRPHYVRHWVNENDLTRVNGKEIIGHNELEGNEFGDDEGPHAAGESTENAIKEDNFETTPDYHHSSKHHRPSFDDDTTESDQSERRPSHDDEEENDQSDERTKSSQSDLRESDETERGSKSEDTETQTEDNPHGHWTVDDKNEKHEELRDGLEETTMEESPAPSIPLSKPAASLPNEDKLKEEIFKKLSRTAVMHLTFDQKTVKPGRKIVSDESGNKNDADLVNGAAISNRTMGSCGRVAVLRLGEVMYKAEHFSRKPTKAASIAMWVKSSRPGLVRWFDVGDHKKRSSRTKHINGKLVKIPKNQWIHLAGTFDSRDGIARVYVNGKLISERVGKKNQGLPDDFTTTGIGKKFGDKFISFLDEVFMFDRVLAPAEVRMLYKKCEFNRMVLHFGFQNVNTTTHQLMDQSGLDNNATLEAGAHILNSGCDKCGACLDASSEKMPGVFLDGKKFHHKPKSAISISSWISLNQTKGRHSIFQAVSDKNDEWHDIYNLDVVNGKLHWRHKGENNDVIFDVITQDVVIPEGLWSHVTATYNSESGNAKLYVNGILKASLSNIRKPKLNVAWGRVLIAGHLPDARNFAGLLDEFFIYNWELDPSEVRFVLKYCADKPKLVSFTVRVPLFKRQRVQQAPHALKYL
ncbi:uncharacterized protein [Montipora foliosa]|uniref:uncharacterized protein n=1 Tax=Montipora foliosa TaxID=591990 RepID=UPI0035F1D7E8